MGFVELNSVELNQTLREQHKSGLIVHSIIARLEDSIPLYSVIFRKEAVYIESHAYWGVVIPSHIMSMVNMKRRGWYMVNQHFLTFPNQTSVSAIYHRDLRRVYNVPLREIIPVQDTYYGFRFSTFSSLTLDFLHQNYDTKYVSTYHHGDKGDAHFSVIYEAKVDGQRSASQWIRWALNSSQVFNEIEFFKEHWDIVYMVSYVYSTEVLYIMEWGRKIGY